MKFENCTEEERRIIQQMPPISEDIRNKINGRFQDYAFYTTKKDGIRVTTTCCGEDKRCPFIKSVMDETYYDFMGAKHNDDTVCPFCGKPVVKKCCGKLKSGASLSRTERFLILENVGDGLYAQAWQVSREFDKEVRLNIKPRWNFESGYLFRKGAVVQFYEDYYSGTWRTTWETTVGTVKRTVKDPWYTGGMYSSYRPYELLNRDCLTRDIWKYSMFELHPRSKTNRFVRYMTIFALYPAHVERLNKLGLGCVVEEMLYYGCKNADVMCWEEEDPVKSFGITKADLRYFTKAEDKPLVFAMISWLKAIRKTGDDLSLEDFMEYEKWGTLLELARWIGTSRHKRIFCQWCKKLKIAASKLVHHLEGFVEYRCYGGKYSIGAVWSTWSDMMDMAVALGKNLQEYAFAQDMELRHVQLLAEQNEKTERQMEEERMRQAVANKKEAEKLRKLELQKRLARKKLEKGQPDVYKTVSEKYGFSYGGLTILAPKTMDEIKMEGTALHHCVKGYATRHFERKTTILFLRMDEYLDKPFVTIEMNGDTILQIHGLMNERKDGMRFAPDPEEVHREFLYIWKSWLLNGSKRDKNGKPIIKHKAKEVA